MGLINFIIITISVEAKSRILSSTDVLFNEAVAAMDADLQIKK